MGKKYQNEQNVPLFGHYVDPFGERRGQGSTRPAQPIQAVEPSFKGAFEAGKLYFAWLGHSSVFLRMGEQNILIDPVFSDFTSPVPFIGPRRFPGKAPKASDFPELDFVLITHSHYDHLDRKTIRSLDAQVKRYVVPEGVGAILKRFGVGKHKITELNRYESCTQDGLIITLTPSQHDSGRSPFSMNRSLWGGFLLRDRVHTVFHSGDGGYDDHFSKLHEKYGDIDLALMECGQYNQRWHAIHMFPEESAQASRDLHAKLSVPIHWGAYVLSDHAWDDPPKRFARHAEELGQTYRIPVINELVIE